MNWPVGSPKVCVDNNWKKKDLNGKSRRLFNDDYLFRRRRWYSISSGDIRVFPLDFCASCGEVSVIVTD
jgi:rRNA maturation endonuclease Nob1